jgi:hypothetical protein
MENHQILEVPVAVFIEAAVVVGAAVGQLSGW